MVSSIGMNSEMAETVKEMARRDGTEEQMWKYIYEAHHMVLNTPRRQKCAIFEEKKTVKDKDKPRMFIQKIKGLTDALI